MCIWFACEEMNINEDKFSMMKKQSRSQEKPLKKFEIKLKNLQNKNEDKKIVLASDAK